LILSDIMDGSPPPRTWRRCVVRLERRQGVPSARRALNLNEKFTNGVKTSVPLYDRFSLREPSALIGSGHSEGDCRWLSACLSSWCSSPCRLSAFRTTPDSMRFSVGIPLRPPHDPPPRSR